MFRRLLHFANHPMVMVVTGAFLAVASAWELGEDLLRMGEGLKGEHGAFLYGISLTMKSLADLGEMDEGLARMDESREIREAEEG